MAKTASQIRAERKERNEKIQQVVSHSKTVDSQNTAAAEKSKAKTLDVLNKAISGAADPTKKSALSRAAQLVTDEYKKASAQQKTGPKTATDMQKKKEDQAEEKHPVDSLQIKKDRAQKALDDFDNNKEIDWTDTNQRKAYDAERKRLQDEVDRAGAEIDAREDARTHDTNMERIADMSVEDREQLQQYIESRDARRSVFANPISWYQGYNKETENKNALIDKYGEEELAKLAEIYSRHLHEQNAKKTVEDTQESVNQNWIAAALHNIAAVPARAMGGIEAMAGRLYEQADRTGQYRTLEENTAGDTLSLYGNTVSGQTAQNIAGENGNVVRGALSIGYQGVMSVVDSIARTLLGGGAAGSAALAATNSFTQTVSEATKQGASPQQAVTLGVGKAGIEYLTEKYSIDEVFKFAKTGDTKVWKAAFKQAGVEITTEELTLFSSMAAEAAILREKSSYKQKIGDLVANGASYEDAKAQADNDVWNEALQTAAVSGFAGGLFGSGAAIVGNLAANNAPEVTTEAPQEVPAEIAPAAPAVNEGQQIADAVTAEPSTAPLVDGIQDVTPAPAPLTEGQRDVMAAMDGALGNQPAQQPAIEPAAPKEETAYQDEFEDWGKDPNREGVENPLSDVDTSEAAQMDASDIQQQSTNDAQIKGTGAAEQNFSGKAEYQNLLSEDNVQRDREGDVRPMEVPKTDSFGRRVSELVGNAYGAEITTDKMANTIEELVQEGALGFDVRHNQDSMNTAAEQIAQRGVAATRKQITNAVASGKIRDGDVEQAILLYAMYNSKDTPTAIDNASEILVDLATMANITGRNLQMFRLLRKMTPEGQVTTIRKTVKSNIDSMIKSGAVKKGYTTEIDPELLAEYRKAAGENMRAVSEEQKKASAEKMKTIMDAIYAMEAAKMPATMKAKWDAWRYMAMLGNAKTQVRNIAGNLAFKPYKEVKDKMGALAEKVFVSKDQRTKSLFTDQSLVKWARQDAKTQDVHDALKYSGKLGDDVPTQKIRDNMQIFNNKALDSVRKFVESVPSAGDMLFKNNYYVRSLAGFLKARGYKATDIQSGKVSDTILAEARAYAIQEAMKATFNDSNAFSDFMATGLRYKGDNPFGKALNIAAEGVLPFRRTPANIAVRFSEYSPVGIAKGLWSAATKVRNGEMTAATAIDQLTSGLTGSAVMALGFALAGGMNGIKITGSGADEDEKRQGYQDYALEFSVDGQEYSYKIDWAAPANLPLFVGANIYSVLENAGENTDVSKFTSFIRGMGTAFEPMLALSCMSGFNNLLESARYAEEGEVLYSIVAEAATSYFTQGIPVLVRQTYQATQENKQTTFTKSDDPTIRDLQQTAASIPFAGAEYQTDKRNAWGEKESQGDWMTRAFNSFVNPGTLKKIDNSAAELEISRLNKAGYNVTPNTAARTVSYIDKDGTGHDDVRLTEEQFQKLAETQGQTARKLLDDMISSASYAALTDEQKADAIDTAYLYARKTGEIAAIEDHTGYDQSWFYDVEKGGAEEIVRRVLNSGLNTSMSDLDTAWDRGYNEETFNRELETAYESYSNAPADMRKQVYAEAEGTAKKYIEARDKGVIHEDFVAAAENIAKVKGTGSINKDTGKATVRDIDRRQAIANTSGMSPHEIDIVMKTYMADYDPSDESPETTEMKYDYIRHEMGMSAKEYAATYRAYLDSSKKAQRIAAIRALGYDYGTALKLYKVYSGSMKKKLIDMYG